MSRFALPDLAPPQPRGIQLKQTGAPTAAGGGTPRGAGQALGGGAPAAMARSFHHDFSGVRTHSDSAAGASARALGAAAFARGSDIVFAPGRLAPDTTSGKELLAHELAHVVQQAGGQGGAARGTPALEAEADRAAAHATRGEAVPFPLSAANDMIQRRVEFRELGRGQQSGFARVPELVQRLNAISRALTFTVAEGALLYVANPDATKSEFDRQMIGFIDSGTVLPMRITNRHGLMGDRVNGYDTSVTVDSWSTGYVDIDDLLASSDLGLISALVHFLAERNATRNYARRMGGTSLDTDVPRIQSELDRAHAIGIAAELAVLRDFFSDPSIREVKGAESGAIFRVYINSRRDHIRTRVTSRHGRTDAGVDAVTMEVVTRDGRLHTPEDYMVILNAARAAAVPAATAPAPAP